LSSLNDASFLFLTGLTVEDFAKESQGEMIIEILQMKHKCIITVHDSAAADARYYILLLWIHCSADLSNDIPHRNSMSMFRKIMKMTVLYPMWALGLYE